MSGRRWVSRSGVRALVLTTIAIVSLAFIVVAFFFFLWVSKLDTRLSRLALADARIPVTVTVFGRGTDTVSARVAFYAPGGELLGTVERSWAGWELGVDCVLVRVSGGWVVFPFSVHTDETGDRRGVALFRHYDRAGFPAIYESPQLAAAERSSLRGLFTLVKTEGWLPGFFGRLRHERVTIRSFEAGREYSLFVSKEGRLSLRSE